MLIHADNLSICDFEAFIESHRNRPKGCELTMMLFHTDNPSSCGVVKLDNINVAALASQSIAIVAWTGVALLAGYKWLNQRSEFSIYLCNASYWLYLIHVPLLMYIQLPLMSFSLPASVKLIISVVATLVVGGASYHLFVRNTLLGIFLNGKKK